MDSMKLDENRFMAQIVLGINLVEKHSIIIINKKLQNIDHSFLFLYKSLKALNGPTHEFLVLIVYAQSFIYHI